MLPEIDNNLIYPKLSKKELPVNYNSVSVINIKNPLEYKLSKEVCDTVLQTYEYSCLYYINKSPKSFYYNILNYDVNFAKYLSEQLSTFLPAQLTLGPKSRCDWQSDNPEEYNVWNLEGISPYFNLIKVTPGHRIMPHYDEVIKCPSDPLIRTLYSGVIQLTNNSSGFTAFLDDGQQDVIRKSRVLAKWDDEPNDEDIIEWSKPNKGDIIVYPHEVCKSITPVLKQDLIFLQFGIYYSAFTKR